MTYFDNLSPTDINSYIDYLINQVYSILPVYEETDNKEYVKSKIHNINLKIDGFLEKSTYDTKICIDIISLVEKLETATSHKDVRSCVFKVCHLLSSLKSGGDDEC